MPIKRHSGLTLIELILTIAILGIAATSVLQLINQTTSKAADPVRRKQAMLIAEGLLEEVELARVTACDPSDANAATALTSAGCVSVPEKMGPEAIAGNARPFDNVNDYDGLTTTVDAAGNAFGGGTGAMTGYSATVAITATDKLGPSGALAINGAALPTELILLRITVTVTYRPGTTLVLEGYRTRYAPTVLP